MPSARPNPKQSNKAKASPAEDEHSLVEGKSNSRGCCSCSWLKTSLSSMGWKLDPLVILLSLITTLAALTAGAVQLAVRARTPEQQTAIQQVCEHILMPTGMRL